jgi:hypothetical protein
MTNSCEIWSIPGFIYFFIIFLSTNSLTGAAKIPSVINPPTVFKSLFLNINEFWYSFKAVLVA